MLLCGISQIQCPGHRKFKARLGEEDEDEEEEDNCCRLLQQRKKHECDQPRGLAYHKSGWINASFGFFLMSKKVEEVASALIL